MSRALDLFNRIRKDGLAAIDALVSDLELESMFLDYKGTNDKFTDSNLSKFDNENLAKCISGFANSYGGVVVWGIDSRPDRETGAERVSSKPLAEAKTFAAKVQNAITRLTIPPHDGVEIEVLLADGESPAGYVAVYIPQSSFRPIRAVPRDTYLMRVGSNFVPIPHDSLRLLFGAKPNAGVDVDVIFYMIRRTEKANQVHFAFGLNITNNSYVIAERAYVVLKHGGISAGDVHIGNLANGYEKRSGQSSTQSLVQSRPTILPPSDSQFICDVGLTVNLRDSSDLLVEIVVGADSIFPSRYRLHAAVETLRDLYDRMTMHESQPAGEHFTLKRDA